MTGSLITDSLCHRCFDLAWALTLLVSCNTKLPLQPGSTHLEYNKLSSITHALGKFYIILYQVPYLGIINYSTVKNLQLMT